jgi:hypothetical protein
MIYTADYNQNRNCWEVVAWRTVLGGNRLGLVLDRVSTQELAEEIAETYNEEMATAD